MQAVCKAGRGVCIIHAAGAKSVSWDLTLMTVAKRWWSARRVRSGCVVEKDDARLRPISASREAQPGTRSFACSHCCTRGSAGLCLGVGASTLWLSTGQRAAVALGVARISLDPLGGIHLALHGSPNPAWLSGALTLAKAEMWTAGLQKGERPFSPPSE
ncbi:uncharacterized protein K452DRAFT_139498 [Aplosporella prunicola CBS 121167]|uniref:Uncharacterized protein n=1 Tax=Aplosporella prunicola CBS 121167 TaxID=1176127 RepID=A0A6A6B0K4_9PEZI|nr:uncharacterized protein K452DRAFT_139498 [Aplosporella prunicola CBS 121167]KAF2136241.1 hypothetical protein K452DRAFT_139498 [Aplosporella prunicola CBS 121167]